MEKELEKIITPILDQYNAFLVDLKIGKSKRATHIHLFVDKESVLNIDDCYLISKDIKKAMYEKNLWNEGIQLEVSSPGTDRPLKFLKQFHKYLGKTFKVKYKIDENVFNEELKLENIDGEILNFSDGKQINYNQIIEAKVKISFK